MVYTPICTQHFMSLWISATSSPSNLIRSESSAKSSAALPFSIERPRNHLPNAEVQHVDLFCQFSWVLKSSQIFGASRLRILSWNFPGSFLFFTETCHPRVWLALRHEPIPALESWLRDDFLLVENSAQLSSLHWALQHQLLQLLTLMPVSNPRTSYGLRNKTLTLGLCVSNSFCKEHACRVKLNCQTLFRILNCLKLCRWGKTYHQWCSNRAHNRNKLQGLTGPRSLEETAPICLKNGKMTWANVQDSSCQHTDKNDTSKKHD